MPVLPGSGRSQSQEGRDDGRVQPSGRHRRLESHVSLTVAKDAAYLGLKPDSRNFTVAVRQVQAERLRAFRAAGHAARRHAYDGSRGKRASAPHVAATTRPNGSRPVSRFPAAPACGFRTRAWLVVDNAKIRAGTDSLCEEFVSSAERSFNGKIVVRSTAGATFQRQQTDDPSRRTSGPRTREIGEDILAKSETVPVTYVPSDEGGDTSHGFRFRAPVGRYVHVLVKRTCRARADTCPASLTPKPVKVEPYPRRLKFLGEGALLAPSGDRKIGFLVRDVETVQVEVGRRAAESVAAPRHARCGISRRRISIRISRIGWSSGSARCATIAAVRPENRATTTWTSRSTCRTRPVSGAASFLLRVRAVPRPADRPWRAGRRSVRYQRTDDLRPRLILVTDLGFFVKAAKDGSRDVFVQSIRSGLPVPGARVSLVGQNGLASAQDVTDATGRAHLPAPPRDLAREKYPQMVRR